MIQDPVAVASTSAPTHASGLTEQDPWPGLASYHEEDTAFFAAREAECDELEERVLQNRLTVLHGLSGLGKSSLLRAGLFPALRARQCLPVYLRLNFAPDAQALIDQVFAAIEAAAREARAKPPVRQDAETLWEYFQRHGNAFWSERNRLLTPVLAFDQFEEIFTLGVERRAEESKVFLEAIADLAEGRAPQAVKARLDRSPAEAARAFDFSRSACRVLLSLREDYLAHLEDLRHLMPTLGNRMRLRPLNGIQALAVVRNPGGSLVTKNVAERIVAAVAGARQRERPAEEQEIDPALLCLLCRELNRRRIKDKATQINAGMLTEQVRAVILGEYYEEAVGRVSALARHFVEDKLLLASGQRDSVALEVARDAGVDDAEIEALVAERLVRREERGGVVRLELTHDVLTDVVRASRDQRQEREVHEQAERELEAKAEQSKAEVQARYTRRMRVFAVFAGILAVVASVAAVWAIMETGKAQVQRDYAEKASEEALEERQKAEVARKEAEKAREEADNERRKAQAATQEAQQALEDITILANSAPEAVAQLKAEEPGIELPILSPGSLSVKDVGDAGRQYLEVSDDVHTQKFRKFRQGLFTVGSKKPLVFLASHTDKLRTLKLTQPEINVMTAMAENEGNLDAINTWDSAFLSFGMLQWAVGQRSARGELPGLLARIKAEDSDLFERYFGSHGLDLAEVTPGLVSGYFTLGGVTLKTETAKAQLRQAPWAFYFWLAGQDPAVQAMEFKHAIDRLDQFYSTERYKVGEYLVSDLVTSEYGVALLLDNHINRPAYVRASLSRALKETGLRDPANWGTEEERKLIDAYLNIRITHGRNPMTDAEKRARVTKKYLTNGIVSDRRGSFKRSSSP